MDVGSTPTASTKKSLAAQEKVKGYGGRHDRKIGRAVVLEAFFARLVNKATKGVLLRP